MKNAKIQIVSFRRKREGKTNYRKRMASITSSESRLVARKTLTKIIVQIIDFKLDGDVVKASAISDDLKKLGWKGSVKNTPAAYLIGYMIGKKSLKAGIKKANFDIGFATSFSGAKIYAVLKGAIDAGLDMNASEKVFPSEDRINGKHIEGFENNVEEIKSKIE